MTDVVDKATRSRMMSGIKGKNTHPEIYIRRRLHSMGFRFRLHVKDIPGKPDIVFPRYRALISIHGCFWHGHNCRYFKYPKTNPEFWASKIGGTRERDIRNQNAQQEYGWRQLIIWECAIRKDMGAPSFGIPDLIAGWLNSNTPRASIDEEGIHFP